MKLFSLTTNEQAANVGATHMASVTADDLITTTANTAQTIKLIDLLIGDIVTGIWWRLKTVFQNSADTAFNSDTMSVGDNTAVTTFIAAAELNANGTSVKEGFSNTAVGPYTAASAINVTFNAMAAKNLNSLNKGELIVFFRLLRPSVLEGAKGSGQITTK